MKKRKVLQFFVLLVSFTVLLAVLHFFHFGGLTGFAIFSDARESDFAGGTYTRTEWNTNHIELSSGEVSGEYASQIFDAAGTSVWNNISWTQGGPYQIDLPDSGASESGWISGNITMSGNLLLLHLDENNGATSFDDTSGNNYDFSCTGTTCPTAGQDGKFAKALNFDGDNDNIIDLDPTSINPQNAITIETWIYWRGESNQDYDLQNIVTNGAWNRALRITEPDHGVGGNLILSNFKIGSGGGSLHELYSNKQIETNKWHHIATTYNGSLLKIYIDGVLDASETASGQITSAVIATSIGAEEGGVSNFNGLIDEVAIYNRSLSSQEILERYKRGALRLDLSVRSCNDALCSGENWIDVNDNSPQELSVNDNQYFQYKFELESNNETLTPELYNVTVDYSVQNVAPSLTLVLPSDGDIFNYNTSLALNFSVSDLDGNLDSCWYNLDNGINISLLECANTTFGVVEGSHALNIYANDTLGEEASDSASFLVDASFPLIMIIYPQETIYGFVQTVLNYSVIEENLDSCLYSINSGQTNVSVTCGQNITGLTSSEGNNTWIVYANDTAGNKNSSSVTFRVDTLAPTLAIILPGDGSTLGTNLSISLSYSVSDANLDSCWYNINNGNNLTLLNCENTTFDVSGSGEYAVNLYANDSLGHETSESVSFSVSIGAPSITATAPVRVYLNYTEISFVYTASDVDLDSCELWGNFDGEFKRNQTNPSVISGQQSFFSLSLSDGTYDWSVSCNDTFNNIAFTGNQTFYVDTIFPSITLTQPTGTKTSRTGIPLTFSAGDASPISCVYNVEWSTGGIVKPNANVICNAGSANFDVAADGNYALNFYVNDSAGNINFARSSFSVDTSSQPQASEGGGSSGGGGGGGGPTLKKGYNETTDINLEFSQLEQILLKRGTTDKIELIVTNKEKIFLNNCNLIFNGTVRSWLNSNQVKGLSPGEKFVFDIDVSVPETAEPGEYFANVLIQCDDGKAEQLLKITTYRNSFEAEILGYEREGNELKVNYSLTEYAGESHDLIIDYSLIDFDGVARFKGQEIITLNAKEETEKVIQFSLPKDSFGEFNFKMTLNDGLTAITLEKNIFLPSQKGLAGLAISNDNKLRLTIFGVVIAALVFLFFAFWIFKRFRKNTNNLAVSRVRSKKRRDDLIEIEL